MIVRLAPRALSEAERLKTWWQRNRPTSPDLVEEELAAAIDQIRSAPAVGAVYPSNFGSTVRRLLMPKTKNHVYYLVGESEVVILSVWGAPRGRTPKL